MSEAAVEKAPVQKMNTVPFKMIGKNVSVYYGEKRALFDVNLNVQ
jgi:phosphate transport system ATP-binding protein